MPITATRAKTALLANDFSPRTVLVDPRDGSPVDALTNFQFQITTPAPKTVDGRFANDDSMRVVLTPLAFRLATVTMSTGLISHEQFHWDCAFVVGRRLAKVLAGLRGSTAAELESKSIQARDYHFGTRNNLIQRRYDLDTHHGTSAHYQKIWKDRMSACLADRNATQIGGFYL